MTLGLFLAIALSSMIPVTELRATIPLFLASNPSVPVWFIFIAAVIGNMIPNFFLLWILPRLTEWLHDHLAPRINNTVIRLHDIFITNKRFHYIYLGIVLLTALGLYILSFCGVENLVWYMVMLFAVPIWAYIVIKICEKAYRSALEETSIIHWFYSKVSKEHSDKFYRRGSIALVLIVGLPVPGTGSWTGSVLAFLFNVPYWKALGLIFLGILISGTIVTAVSTGIINGLGLI